MERRDVIGDHRLNVGKSQGAGLAKDDLLSLLIKAELAVVLIARGFKDALDSSLGLIMRSERNTVDDDRVRWTSANFSRRLHDISKASLLTLSERGIALLHSDEGIEALVTEVIRHSAEEIVDEVTAAEAQLQLSTSRSIEHLLTNLATIRDIAEESPLKATIALNISAEEDVASVSGFTERRHLIEFLLPSLTFAGDLVNHHKLIIIICTFKIRDFES